jgi:predicted lysophospholipase L1 biosynthesis ABC-type transport system permease subunit
MLYNNMLTNPKLKIWIVMIANIFLAFLLLLKERECWAVHVSWKIQRMAIGHLARFDVS